MNAEELKQFPLEDLKQMASDMGLVYSADADAAALAEKIAAVDAAVKGDPTPESPAQDGTEGVILSPSVLPEPAPQPKPHTATQTGVLPDPQARKFLEMCTPENVRTALAVHLRRGLEIVSLDENFWHIRNGNREDCGNMKMPVKSLVQCANMLMTKTDEPTEGMDIDDILELKRKHIR